MPVVLPHRPTGIWRKAGHRISNSNRIACRVDVLDVNRGRHRSNILDVGGGGIAAIRRVRHRGQDLGTTCPRRVAASTVVRQPDSREGKWIDGKKIDALRGRDRRGAGVLVNLKRNLPAVRGPGRTFAEAPDRIVGQLQEAGPITVDQEKVLPPPTLSVFVDLREGDPLAVRAPAAKPGQRKDHGWKRHMVEHRLITAVRVGEVDGGIDLAPCAAGGEANSIGSDRRPI